MSPTPAPGSTRPPVPAGSLVAWNSGLCLGADSAEPGDGTAVVQQACGSPTARRFRQVEGPDGTLSLVDTASGLCLDVDGGRDGDGVPVVFSSCQGGANQLFRARPVGKSGGRIQLVAEHSGKCLEVADGSTAPGGRVQQYGCHPPGEERIRRNQSWLVAA
jgi:hypothetical protein